MSVLTLREVRSEEAGTFDSFVVGSTAPSVMQMQPWTSVIEEQPHCSAVPLFFEDQGQVVATALLTVKRFGLGLVGVSCNGGPILQGPESLDLWQTLIRSLVRWARRKRAIFLRMQPSVPFCEELADLLRRERFIPYNRPSPEGATRVIDLSLSPDELLAQMHPSSRRDVRVALRKNVCFKTGTDNGLLDSFYEIYYQTCNFRGLVPRSRESIRALLQAGIGSIHLGLYEDVPINGNLLIHHPRLPCVVLLCSGTNRQTPKVPVGPFVHWHAMRWAQDNSFSSYDLGGIGIEKRPRERLEGVDVFKRRLGGSDVRIFGEHQWCRLPRWLLNAGQLTQHWFRQLRR